MAKRRVSGRKAPLKSKPARAKTGASEAARVVRVELEIPIDAARDAVWRAIVRDIGAWWPADFLCVPGSGGIRLESKPGGRVYEENAAGGGLLWFTIAAIDPGASMHLSGIIAPPWGGPCSTVVWLRLEDAKAGTLLRVSDSLVGHVSAEQERAMTEGWTRIFAVGLKQFVERG